MNQIRGSNQIMPGTVTNDRLADMLPRSIKGNKFDTVSVPQDLTVEDLNLMGIGSGGNGAGFIQIHEDLSSQVGSGNHFVISAFAESLFATVNGLVQKVSDVILDPDCIGFTFTGIVNVGDEFIVRYETGLENLLTDDTGHLLYDDANELLFA